MRGFGCVGGMVLHDLIILTVDVGAVSVVSVCVCAVRYGLL